MNSGEEEIKKNEEIAENKEDKPELEKDQNITPKVQKDMITNEETDVPDDNDPTIQKPKKKPMKDPPKLNYSWAHDEKFGWVLIEEDYTQILPESKIIFYKNLTEKRPAADNKLSYQLGEYIIHNDCPTKIEEISEDGKSIYIKPVGSNQALEESTANKTQSLENRNLSSLLRLQVNIHLKNDIDPLFRQIFVDINDSLKDSLDKIRIGLFDLDPICLEIYHNETDQITVDASTKFWQNLSFRKDEEIDVIIMTRMDVLTVRLYKEVSFVEKTWKWNSMQIGESVKIVGFGVIGAYRRINQTGVAICEMFVTNLRTKAEQSVKCIVDKHDFNIHSFFFKVPIDAGKGDPINFTPKNPQGSLYEISSDCQEYCGEDGTKFSLSNLDNCIAALYYI